MFETDAELAELDAMFQAHLANANPHMLAIVTPERRVNARQVANYLVGTKHVAFATVNAKGEPRVSPLDSLFIHGRFTLSTGRSRHQARSTFVATPPARRCTSRVTGSRWR